MWKGIHVKYPLVSLDFNEILIFSTHSRKQLKYKVSSKCVQCEPSCSMRTDRQTDMTTLTVAFRNFANAPKNHRYIVLQYEQCTRFNPSKSNIEMNCIWMFSSNRAVNTSRLGYDKTASDVLHDAARTLYRVALILQNVAAFHNFRRVAFHETRKHRSCSFRQSDNKERTHMPGSQTKHQYNFAHPSLPQFRQTGNKKIHKVG